MKPVAKTKNTEKSKAKEAVPIPKKRNWAFTCGCVGCGGMTLIIILIVIAIISFILFGGEDQLGIGLSPFQLMR